MAKHATTVQVNSNACRENQIGCNNKKKKKEKEQLKKKV